MLSRRNFIMGLGALAAPAIVPYINLMPVRSLRVPAASPVIGQFVQPIGAPVAYSIDRKSGIYLPFWPSNFTKEVMQPTRTMFFGNEWTGPTSA